MELETFRVLGVIDKVTLERLLESSVGGSAPRKPGGLFFEAADLWDMKQKAEAIEMGLSSGEGEAGWCGKGLGHGTLGEKK